MFLNRHHSMVSNPHSLSGQKRSLRISQSQTITSSFLSYQLQQPQKTSLRRMLCSKVSCQRTWRTLTKSPLKNFRKSRTRSTLKMRTNLKMSKTSQKNQGDSGRTRQTHFKTHFKTRAKKSALLKADFVLRYTLLHATSGDPNVMVRRIMRTSDSDSGAVTGLEIWRQMSIHFAGSAKTRTVSLLKQIMSPVEKNAEKSKDVIQLCYHWLELISKYEAISSEKITDTVKITLALQNVKGNLAQSFNVSISDSMTWSEVHALLINYFNNAVPVDLKPIYQFDQSEKTEINSFKKGKGKGQKSKGQKGKGSKGSSSFQNPKGKSKGKGKTKSKGKGQWTTWSWGQNQNSNWGQNQKGQKGSKSGKGKSACSICGKSGHTSNQCWWNRDQEGWNSQGSATQLKGDSGSQYSKEVCKYPSIPSRSTNSESTSGSTQRISRSTTSSSTTAVPESESSVNTMRIN